jgi:hypothetical protein
VVARGDRRFVFSSGSPGNPDQFAILSRAAAAAYYHSIDLLPRCTLRSGTTVASQPCTGAACAVSKAMRTSEGLVSDGLLNSGFKMVRSPVALTLVRAVGAEYHPWHAHLKLTVAACRLLPFPSLPRRRCESRCRGLKASARIISEHHL